MLVCVRYIGALDRGLAPTRGGGGADLKVVESSRVTVLLNLRQNFAKRMRHTLR